MPRLTSALIFQILHACMWGRAALPQDIFIVQAVSASVIPMTGVAVTDIVVLSPHVLKSIRPHYRTPWAWSSSVIWPGMLQGAMRCTGEVCARSVGTEGAHPRPSEDILHSRRQNQQRRLLDRCLTAREDALNRRRLLTIEM